MNIALIQQYYRTATSARQQEIDTCLRNNLSNPMIDKVHLLTEELYCLTEFPETEKIRQTVIGERLSFARAFRYANAADPHGQDAWLLANADIHFDDTLAALRGVRLDGVVFALTRHDIQPDGSLTPAPAEFAHGSQDCWIFRTPIPVDRLFADFPLGVPGCDNRIAYELIEAGYKLLNPSLSIVARHLDLARQSDIFARNDLYRDASQVGDADRAKYVSPPHQFHLYPVAETDPDAPAVFRMHMRRLSEQHDRICRQAEQITGQGRLLADLYRTITSLGEQIDRQAEEIARQAEEIARQIQDNERLRSSLSWRLTRR